MYRTLVLTSQTTQSVSSVKINQLLLFRTIIDVGCDDRWK
jgi:hypothetical protein